MILVTIVLIFLVRVGLKIAYIGVSVSSYIHERYEKKHELGSVVKAIEKEDTKEATKLAFKKSMRLAGRAGRFLAKKVILLLDLSLGLLNKLMIFILGYVVVVDIIVGLMLVGGAGYFVLLMTDGDKGDLVQVVSDVITGRTDIASGGSTGGESGSTTGSGDGTGGVGDSTGGSTTGGSTTGGSTGGTSTTPTGNMDQDVYNLLASDSGYSNKASALAVVYSKATAKWGRNTAIGIMANIVAEGSPGKVEGINFRRAFENGSISASRKVTLNCNCSKKGTVTIDYWAQAPCSAHQVAGTVIDSKSDVEALLSIGGNVAGIGVGSVQWSGARRQGILYKYNNLSNFSSDNLLLADVEYIMEELEGSYSNVISSCQGKSASECAKIICNNYEKPASADAARNRANTANDLNTKLSGINK